MNCFSECGSRLLRSIKAVLIFLNSAKRGCERVRSLLACFNPGRSGFSSSWKTKILPSTSAKLSFVPSIRFCLMDCVRTIMRKRYCGRPGVPSFMGTAIMTMSPPSIASATVRTVCILLRRDCAWLRPSVLGAFSPSMLAISVPLSDRGMKWNSLHFETITDISRRFSTLVQAFKVRIAIKMAGWSFSALERGSSKAQTAPECTDQANVAELSDTTLGIPVPQLWMPPCGSAFEEVRARLIIHLPYS